MKDINSATMKCGYYDIDIKIGSVAIGHHTYGRANNETVNFQCYGTVHGGKAKHEVYPAKFSGLRRWRSKTITVDLERARYYAANGQKGWKKRSDYNKIPKDIFHPKKSFFGDCSGLWYAVGGVCHQMANSIFVAEGKGVESSLVWPPEFNATRAIYGVRGNHRWSWHLPHRLKHLMKEYPREITEDIDRMVQDIKEMQLARFDTDEWTKNMMRENQLLLGDNYAKPGHEEAYVDLQRQLRQQFQNLNLPRLSGSSSNSDFANKMNTAAAKFGENAAQHLQDNLAKEHREIKGAAIDHQFLPTAKAHRWLGERLGIR